MSKAIYYLTEEHKLLVDAHNKRWIDVAMSTKQMDDEEKAICRGAVGNLYKAANLEAPRVVFVEGVSALTVATALAVEMLGQGIQRIEYTPSSRLGVCAYNAVIQACGLGQPLLPVPKAELFFNEEAFLSGIHVQDIKNLLATVPNHKEVRANMDSLVSRLWQSGNEGADEASYVEFGRLIAELGKPPYGPNGKGIQYDDWMPWLLLCKHSGPRTVTKEFCMISDRPEVLAVNDFDQPHRLGGPAKLWRDGVGMYCVDGSRVPAIYVEQPNTLSLQTIEEEANGDVRAALIQIYGTEEWLVDCGAKVEHEDYVPAGGGRSHSLMRVLLSKEVNGEVHKFVLTHDASTPKLYAIPVAITSTTCEEAIKSITGLPDSTCVAQS
jgi:hypothetical protein